MNKDWEKGISEKIASLLVASSLFNSQISDKGGKTINFSVYEENLSKEIDEFKSFISQHFIPKSQLLETIGKMRKKLLKRDDAVFATANDILKNYNYALDDVVEKINEPR